MSGTVYLIDADMHEHAPWAWDTDYPPRVIERLRPGLPLSEIADSSLPDAAIPLARVEFQLVSAFRSADRRNWSAIYLEHA